LTTAEIVRLVKGTNRDCPAGWSGSGITQLFQEVFGARGQTAYRELIADKVSLWRILQDRLPPFPRPDGNEAVSGFSDEIKR
jgi:hypothetical protein